MGKKKLVTHFNPDLDAVTAIWLVVRWLEGWEEAEVEFVPAGKTYQGQEVDSDPDTLHVDTGLGTLDHHQTDEYTCAAKLTLEYIIDQRVLSSDHPPSDVLGSPKSNPNASLKGGSPAGARQGSPVGSHPLHDKDDSPRKEKLRWNEEALERLVEVVNQVDHFQEVYYPDSEADDHEFAAEAILDGWKLLYREQDKLVVEKGLELIDGVYTSLVSRVDAEKILASKGESFQTKWGKGIAFETKNASVVDIAQKRGYAIAVRRHPVEGHIRIKAPPANFIESDALNKSVDLTPIYNVLKKADAEADWFLHSSKTMLLNGSAKNPQMRPTKLSLKEVVEIVKNA